MFQTQNKISHQHNIRRLVRLRYSSITIRVFYRRNRRRKQYNMFYYTNTTNISGANVIGTVVAITIVDTEWECALHSTCTLTRRTVIYIFQWYLRVCIHVIIYIHVCYMLCVYIFI